MGYEDSESSDVLCSDGKKKGGLHGSDRRFTEREIKVDFMKSRLSPRHDVACYVSK